MDANITTIEDIDWICHLTVFCAIMGFLYFILNIQTYLNGRYSSAWSGLRLHVWYAIPIYASFLLVLQAMLLGGKAYQDLKARQECKEEALRVALQARQAPAKPAVVEERPYEMPDYRDEVMDILERAARWPSKLARAIAMDWEEDEERTKFAVSKAIKGLQDDGAISRLALNIEGKDIKLYYKRDPSLSGLHKFMETDTARKLRARGTDYTLAQPGESVSDIVTKDFDIELETGLKHDLAEFTGRMADARKRTYVIVPTQAEKERYQKIIGNPAVTVVLLDEF